MQIIVNGKSHETEWEQEYMNYYEICNIAKKDYKLNPSVTWSTKNYQGTLLSKEGKDVKLEEGMIFNVALTGNS